MKTMRSKLHFSRRQVLQVLHAGSICAATVAVLCWCSTARATGDDAWHLTWVRELPARASAWAHTMKMPRDEVYRMAAAEDVAVVGATSDSTLRAFDLATGRERWRFAFSAPVRWAPVIVGDTVLAASDDGTLACLALADGKLRWRYRPGPGGAWSAAHERLTSLWPIATAPAAIDGVVYGAAGTWIFDGVWIFAVDLASGEERWLRRSARRVTGQVTAVEDKVSIGGLVVDRATGTPVPNVKLPPALPASSSIPVLRARGGAYVASAGSVSCDVEKALQEKALAAVALPEKWSVWGPMPRKTLGSPPEGEVAAGGKKYVPRDFTPVEGVIDLMPLDPAFGKPEALPDPDQEAWAVGRVRVDRAGHLVINVTAKWFMEMFVDGKSALDTLDQGNIAPFKTLTANTAVVEVAAGEHRIALRVRPGDGGWGFRMAVGLATESVAQIAQRFPGGGRAAAAHDPTGVKGTVIQSHAAAGRLTVLTSTGRLLGFRREALAELTEPAKLAEPQSVAPAGPAVAVANALAAASDGGWALIAGLEDGALVEAIAAQRFHRVIAVDSDARRIAAVRARLDRAGRTADNRVQIVEATLTEMPPWVFSVIVSERPDPLDAAVALGKLRPFGGLMAAPEKEVPKLLKLEVGLDTVRAGGLTLLRRPGRLPGTEDWTHELADASQRNGLAEDALRLPYGSVWYGGYASAPANYMSKSFKTIEGTPLPPTVLISRGTWILQGATQLTSIDQYNGRHRWSIPLPAWFVYEGLGIHTKDNVRPWEDPVADRYPIRPTQRCRSTGFNSACGPDAVYLCVGPDLWDVALADGAVRQRWKVPLREVGGEPLCWGTPLIVGDVIVATAFAPSDLRDARIGWDGNGGAWVKDRQPMRHLLALDRATGKPLWSKTARLGFLNHGTAVGNGRVYAVDLLVGAALEGLARSGKPVADNEANKATVAAWNLRSGKELWRQPLAAMVPDIHYAAAHDILLLPSRFGWTVQGAKWVESSGATAGKKGKGPANGVLVARRGADGGAVYEHSAAQYKEPFSLIDNRASHRSGLMFDLLGGELLERPHPVTGKPATWDLPEGGCTYVTTSRWTSGFRCGWTDLRSGLAGAVGDTDSGCSPSWITSGGLLNSPNLATLRFSNRPRAAAMALAHRPAGDFWCDDRGVASLAAKEPGVVRRLGLLPGAPGNRFDEQGNWWLRIMPDGRIPLAGSRGKARPKDAAAPAQVYEIAPHRMRGAEGLPAWVGSFGLSGVSTLEIPLVVPAGAVQEERLRHRIRLVFVEPDAVRPGQRVFSVAANGVAVAKNLDVAKQAGRRVALVREAVVETPAKDPVLRLEFVAAAGSLPPLCGGILIEMENHR